jgi:hypothetical protein
MSNKAAAAYHGADTLSDLKWLAVDLDGTLFRNNWSPENPDAGVGEPIWANIRKAYEAYEAGYKIVIHTARAWADYQKIEKALTGIAFPFKAIVCGKILAAAYIDDRAIPADHPDWLTAVKEINS